MAHAPNTHPENEAHGNEEHADDWHHHSVAEGEPQRENVSKMNTRNVAIGFVILSGSIAIKVVLLVMFFDSYTTTKMASLKETTQSSEQYLTYRASAERVLGLGDQAGEYNWAGAAAVDAPPVLQIPVDEAARKVIQAYQKK